MAKLLDTVNGPEDLRRLDLVQLGRLARELREEIVSTVSMTGGHLAASLGAVELTVALHTVFSSPRDRIVWDVGHQAYAHKLLTGRRHRFHTLRQAGGISGFPRRHESIHDHFNAGHASTSISAALGFAVARDLSGARHHVVAVIGDGALTGGLAFEGLNNAGLMKTNLIVVINDNEMSISSNVGALSSYLSRIRSAPAYYRVKSDVQQALSRIPYVGKTVSEAATRVKDSVRNLVVPGALFEELGFTYLGPIDGHDIGSLQDVLRGAARIRGPVVVHAITRKGKGYPPAERDPDAFHGPGPFDRDTGVLKPNHTPSFSQVFGSTLVRLAREDRRIVAITAAMPGGTGLSEFAREFPGRFFDVGIAEQHAVTFAAGLAASGLKPVVAIYSTFLQRAYDQLVHDVCLQDLGVVLAIDRAGIVGEDGETHQGQFDLAFLRHIPNLTVMAPADEHELEDMLATAVTLAGPSAVRYPRGAVCRTARSRPAGPLTPGVGRVLRQGRHVALVAVGNLVQVALGAAELLLTSGIDATVADARFVTPLDHRLLRSLAARHPYLVTLEENTIEGGFGSAVLESLAGAGTNCQVTLVGIPRRFIEHGAPGHIRRVHGLDAEGIAGRVLALVRGTRDLVSASGTGRGMQE
ncbi:MAG: 1-deoxy-D-xylulose-5-phosphate synthase [Bacillota bacterium]